MQKLPIYGINEFVEDKNETAFYANNLRTHLQTHQFINSPHKHNTYITIFCTKGSGIHQIDFDTFIVKPGAIFLMSPGQVHCWQLSDDIEGSVFFHTKDFYNSIFINRKIEDFSFFYLQQNYPVVYLGEDDISRFERVFEEIITEFKSHLLHRNEKLGALVDFLYISLSRLYQIDSAANPDKNTHYLQIKKLQKLIDENYKTIKSPNVYADLMNVSTRHLSRLSQEVLNKSTSDLIAERIIIETKRMLVHEAFSIAQIADELGYEDYSYFIRMFKNKAGMTPKEFQTKLKAHQW